MKRNRFLSFFLAGLMLFSFLSVFPNDSFSPFTMMEANAAEGRLYNQNDSYWKTVTFTKYASSGNSMYTSGCGIFSFCNAIYALNGSKIDAKSLATWAVGNGSYQPGNGGLYRQTFYNKIQAGYGSSYGFKIDGQYYGTISDSRLITHLQNGGVAAIHVSNHFMAVTGYNANNGTYHVIESAVYSGRGLAADSWVTASKLSSGLTDVDWYALISNNGSTEQPWYTNLSPSNLGDDFYAYIENNNIKVLLSNISSNVQGAQTIGSNNQIWNFKRQNDGSYAILSYSDGLSMDVEDYGTTNGTNIQMMPYVGHTAQHFFIYYINGVYFFRPACSDLVFDMDANSYDLATWQYDVTYLSKQFNIYKIDCDGNMPVNLGETFHAFIKNKNVEVLLSNINSNVQGAEAISSSNQIWNFELQSDGSYAILSYSDGLSMDVADYGTSNGTNIQMMPFVGNAAQRFFIYHINNAYYFKPVCSDLVFDMDASSYNLATYQYDETYLSKQFEIDVINLSNTLYFDTNNGTCATKNKTLTYGSTYGVLPEATRTGYTFAGWYTAKEGGTQITEDSIVSVTTDQTLYAHWTANKYTVTFKPTGGTCDTASKSVTYNSTYGDLPKPTRTGHVFKGWFTAESGGTQITKDSKVTITANQTLSAQWTLNSYTVTLDANGGTVSDDSVTVTYSKGYGTLPEPTRDGYTFLGWFTEADGGTEVTASTTVTTNKNHTLYAHWEKNKVVGDVNADGTFNVADVVMLQKWLICTPNATLTDWQAADMCEDNRIDVFDLCLMKRELLKKS